MSAAAPRTAGPVARGPQRRFGDRRVLVFAVVVLTALAAAARLYRLAFGYAHAVTGYDDGVYLGSALHLVHGDLPYRDFVFVHPPVITLLMTPVALLGNVIGSAQAMGIAKILTGLAGAAAVPLGARLVWHRGAPAVLLVTITLAVHPDVVPSAYELFLEPWLVLLTLLGMVLVFDRGRVRGGRALMWGGIVLGLACATKIWAFVPALLMLAVLLPDRQRARRYLASLAAGFLVPVLPFALLAPGAFLNDVFIAQALRGATHRTSTMFRILHLFSVGTPNGDSPGRAFGWLVVAGLVVAALLAVLVVRLTRRRSPLDRFVALSAAGVVAMMFIPTTFYWHYSAFVVPFLALVAALGLPRRRGRARRAVGVVLVVALISLAFTLVHRDSHDYVLPDESRRFQAVVPAGSCVVATVSSRTIADDRFAANARSCPALLDSFGTALVHGDPKSVERSGALQRTWLAAYRRADFVYLTPLKGPSAPRTGASMRYLHTHFRRLHVGGLHGDLWQRSRQ